MSTLDKDLTDRIARDLNISPEEVTPEFMLKWREEHLYPKLKISVASGLGGHNTVARRYKTSDQIKAEGVEAMEILRRLTAIDPGGPK